jgi:glycerol uptake facilitator-like aquaporin
MLPQMTPGTWFFMAVMVWVGFNFLWIGLVEKYVSQWVGAIIATLLAIVVFKYGPRPRDEEEE